MTEIFKLTEKHIKLLSNLYVSDDYGPTIDQKRPFGNSSIFSDVAEILEIEPKGNDGYEDELSDEQVQDMNDIYFNQLGTALAIVLTAKSFDTGKYRKTSDYGYKWERVD